MLRRGYDFLCLCDRGAYPFLRYVSVSRYVRFGLLPAKN